MTQRTELSNNYEDVFPLPKLKIGQMAIINNLGPNCKGEVRQRFLDLGFVKGAEIFIQNISPLGDPIAYCVHSTQIALRHEDANFILVSLKEI